MSIDQLTIRQAQSSDLTVMIKLLEQLFSIEQDFVFSPEKHRLGLKLMLNQPQAMVLVAEMNNQVVGMITMQLLVSTAEGAGVGLIEDLVVDGAYRQQGIGTRLLAAMQAKAKLLGLKRIQLLADRDNEPALLFYQKHDWMMTHMICMRKK